jgi:hypothetical protein
MRQSIQQFSTGHSLIGLGESVDIKLYLLHQMPLANCFLAQMVSHGTLESPILTDKNIGVHRYYGHEAFGIAHPC